MVKEQDYLEVYERYGDCPMMFSEYSHGILSFVGLTPLKEAALLAIVPDPPSDFTFDNATRFRLGDLPFSEVLVYNPDSEIIERYV